MSGQSGHIVMCGYTSSAKAALAELGDQLAGPGIVVLSRKEIPETEGLTQLHLDYLNVEQLRDPRVGLETCSVCVVFAESAADGGHPRTADMHTVLAIYNIKKERPDLPIIAEVVDRENSSFIDELDCDDVIYKETIDSNLITSCILHPNISPIFYDLLTVRGKVLRSTTTSELGIESTDVTWKDIRLNGLDRDVTYLGFIDPQDGVRLMPANPTPILPGYRLVYIE